MTNGQNRPPDENVGKAHGRSAYCSSMRIGIVGRLTLVVHEIRAPFFSLLAPALTTSSRAVIPLRMINLGRRAFRPV